MICSKCNIEKDSSNYYTYFHSTQQKWRTRRVCNTCFSLQHKQYKQRVSQEKIIQPESPESICGTFEQYLSKVTEEYSKDHLKMIYETLISMGWIYDANTLIWYKPGLKDNNGIWNLPETKYLSIESKRTNKSKITLTQIKDFIKLKNKGWSYAKIAEKHNVDDNTVIRWLKKIV